MATVLVLGTYNFLEIHHRHRSIDMIDCYIVSDGATLVLLVRQLTTFAALPGVRDVTILCYYLLTCLKKIWGLFSC